MSVSYEDEMQSEISSLIGLALSSGAFLALSGRWCQRPNAVSSSPWWCLVPQLLRWAMGRCLGRRQVVLLGRKEEGVCICCGTGKGTGSGVFRTDPLKFWVLMNRNQEFCQLLNLQELVVHLNVKLGSLTGMFSAVFLLIYAPEKST